MRKITILSVAVIAAMLSACAEKTSIEKSANIEYVKAALKVSDASKLFANAEYAKVADLCQSALSDVDKIIEKYPESSIALKVVTDGETRIGPCSLSELRERVIPALDIYAEKKVADIFCAWAVAVSYTAVPLPAGGTLKVGNINPSQRDAALFELAKLAVASRIDGKSPFDAEKTKTFLNRCILAIDSPQLKSLLLPLGTQLSQASNEETVQTPENAPTKSGKKQAAPKIENPKLFLSQAKTEASLVAYDLRAIDSLKKRALSVASADKPIKDDFAKILSDALANVGKISMEEVRNKALSNIAVAFSAIGDNAKAVQIASAMKNPENFREMFSAIADNTSATSYVDSVAIASKLAAGIERDSYLAELSASLSRGRMFAEAVEVTKLIRDGGRKNSALASIAKNALDTGDSKAFAAAASKIPIADADSFVCFVSAKDRISPEALRALALASASLRAIGFDDAFAFEANFRAKLLAEEIASHSEFATTAALIAANDAKLGKGKDALKFLTSTVHRSQPASTFASICEIAVIVFPKDKAFAMEAFEVAADICDGMPADLRTLNSVRLAWALSSLGIPCRDAAKILSDFLPKSFKNLLP